MHAESDRGLRVLGHCFDETACTGCLVPGMLSANSFHTASVGSCHSRCRNGITRSTAGGMTSKMLAAGVSIADGTGWVPLDDDNVLTGLKTLAAKSDAAGLPLLDFHERAARLNFAFVLAVGSKRTPDFELQVACKPRLIRYRSADCWGSRTTRALERRDPPPALPQWLASLDCSCGPSFDNANFPSEDRPLSPGEAGPKWWACPR